MAGRQPADVALTGQPPGPSVVERGAAKGGHAPQAEEGRTFLPREPRRRQDSPNSTVCPGTGTQDRKWEQREVRGPTQLAGRVVREEDRRRGRGPAGGY